MKKIPYTIPQTVLLFTFILLLTACVKEDMDECGTTRVWVKFDPALYELPTGEHHIENVHVYIFNEEERLVDQWQGGSYNYAAGETYEVPVDLPPGTYRFIAWTNTGRQYKTDPADDLLNPFNAPRLSDIELYLEDGGRNLLTEDIPDLHYGTLQKIEVNPAQDKEYTIHLIPNTYRVNLTIKELPVGDEGDEYLFVITDNNTHYNFHNRVIENQQPYSHERTSKREDGQLHASIRTLTLHNDHAIENIGKEDTGDRSPTLTFKSKTDDTELFTGNMVEIIRTAYSKAGHEVDFDRTYEFDIILSFDAEMNLTVSVNGWTYNLNGTEL